MDKIRVLKLYFCDRWRRLSFCQTVRKCEECSEWSCLLNAHAWFIIKDIAFNMCIGGGLEPSLHLLENNEKQATLNWILKCTIRIYLLIGQEDTSTTTTSRPPVHNQIISNIIPNHKPDTKPYWRINCATMVISIYSFGHSFCQNSLYMSQSVTMIIFTISQRITSKFSQF